jgi:hypothetical protein
MILHSSFKDREKSAILFNMLSLLPWLPSRKERKEDKQNWRNMRVMTTTMVKLLDNYSILINENIRNK